MDFYNVLTEDTKRLENVIDEILPSNIKFLVVTPHSGLYVPSICFDNLDKRNYGLKNDVDYYTDRIYDMKGIGGGMLTTKLHRDIIDLNRSLVKNNQKDGVIKEFDFDNKPLLLEEYTTLQKSELIDKFYNPFYSKLNRIMHGLRKKYDNAFLLNGHSMAARSPKSRKNIEEKQRPAFCVGTLEGKSSTKKIIGSFVDALHEEVQKYNLDMELNYPFKGQGNLSKIYSYPKRGYNTILLEVNQNLYLKENNECDEDFLNEINKIITKTMEETLKVI